jgi:hypothetical protein
MDAQNLDKVRIGFGGVGAGAVSVDGLEFSDGAKWAFSGLLVGVNFSGGGAVKVTKASFPGYDRLDGWCTVALAAVAPGAGYAWLEFSGLRGVIGRIEFVPINIGLAVNASAGGGQ